MTEPFSRKRNDAYDSSALVPGILGGVLAAIAGGLVWGLIVIKTDYEVGFAAWGIGFLCGLAVVRFAGGRKGLPLQVAAVVTALLGVALGKYITFAYIYREAAGQAGAGSPSYVSGDTFSAFFDNLGTVFTFWDLLWAGLAVAAAWRIPQPESPLEHRGDPLPDADAKGR
jgi:hypothetical protein